MPEKIPDSYVRQEQRSETVEFSPESTVEAASEQKQEEVASKDHGRLKKRHSAGAQQAAGQPVQRVIDPQVLEIESILASGLDTFFVHLSSEHQLRFKEDGEKTALKIREAVAKKSTKIKDIVLLIIDWLKGLPGINRFFLEQEAKIKADTIMRRYRS